MSLNDLINRFTLVSGLDRKDVSAFLPVILDAKLLFEEKTRGKMLSDADKRRLTHACAAYAFYKISQCNNADCITSFKAGDVSFTVGKLREKAYALWESERAGIGDILSFCDTDFSFMGVRI